MCPGGAIESKGPVASPLEVATFSKESPVPRKRLAMRHISEVLRLAAQDHSQREISSSVGVSRTSVRNYLARAKRAGLSWLLPEQLDAAVVEDELHQAI